MLQAMLQMIFTHLLIMFYCNLISDIKLVSPTWNRNGSATYYNFELLGGEQLLNSASKNNQLCLTHLHHRIQPKSIFSHAQVFISV